MKKLSLVALLAILSACKSQEPEGDAIRALVVLEPSVSATCVLFEVRDPASHQVIKNDWVSRTSDQLKIAIFRGELPADVELAARPYLDGDCVGGTEARTPNGPFETVAASFGKGVTLAGELRLRPGTDGDGDKYVDVSAGGADCKDQDGAVNPGVQEQCTDQADLNCDTKKGCEAATCGANACIGPPTAIALTVPTGQVTAGTCTSGTVQVKDSRGINTRVSAATTIGLQGAPAAGIAFYSDASCATLASGVNLNANEGSATFFFQGKASGTVAVTASSTGLTSATQNVDIIPGPGNRLVFTTPQRTAVAGACSAVVTVQSQDAQGNPAPVSAATAVALSASPATGFKFYTASNCSVASEVTSVNIIAGVSSASFYFSGTKAGPVTVTLTSATLTGSSQVETINAAAPTVIALSGAQTAQAGVCSAAVTAALQDAFGNPANATSNTSVNLSAGGFSFSTNSNCTGSTTSVTVTQGTGSATFYYRSNTAGSATVTGAQSGFTSGTLAVTITPGPASTLAFTTTQQTVTAGVCSSVATVQLRDALGNAVRVATDTAVALSATPPDGFQFFSDSGCATSATSVNMLANASTVSFYFKSTKAGSATLNVAMSSITGSQPVTTNAAAPTVLVFPQSPLSMVAGVCTLITLQTQDAFGNPSNVGTNQTFNLAASPSANFNISSQSGCGNTVTTVTINSPLNSATFYVRGTAVGSVSVTATKAGFTTGTLALTVTPAAPFKVVFTSTAQTIEINACSASTTVQVQDTFSNPSPVGANTTVTLSSSPSGTLTFYAGPGCTNPTTTITITTGTTSGSFFFKDSAVENPTLTAASNPLTSGTQQQTITPLLPTALVFTALPTPVVADICSGTATVQAQAQGSPTTVISATPVNLAASPSTGFLFYSSTNCSGGAVTQVSIGAGQSNVNFSYKGTKAVSESITASNPSIATPATQSVTITPAAPSKLVFTTSALQTVAGVCSAAVTVESRDPNDNTSPVTADKTLTLNLSSTVSDSNFGFYTDSSCSTPAGTPILANGQSSLSLYYKGQVARSVDLAVSTTGLTATPVQTEVVTAASPVALVFSASTPAQTLLAGTCALRKIERQDTYGNPATDTSAVTVALSGAPAAEFFVDSSCNTATTQVSIAAGNSSADFYFKGITGGINATASLSLTATATGLTTGNRTETIIPTVRTGSCSIASNGKSTTCTITPSLGAANKAFLVFQATSQNQPSSQANVRCFLNTNNPIQVQCEQGANGASNIRWSVAEFPAGVAVQHQTLACVATNDTTPATLSAVVQDHTFLLLSSERSVADQGNTVPRLAELTTTTQAEIRKFSGSGCGSGDTNNLEVVDYSTASVQRGLTNMAGGVASKAVDLTAGVATDRSILLYSYFHDSATTKICDRLVRGELTNGGTKVTFTRGDGDTSSNCTSPQINSLSWEVVQFPAGTLVQPFTRQLAQSVTSTTVTLPTAVDLSRTIVVGGGQWSSGQVHGESRYLGGENISEGRVLAYLSDASTLNIARETSSASATFTVYVVQLKP